MIRLFMAGQKVPEWLQKVSVTKGDPELVFGVPVLITARHGEFKVQPILNGDLYRVSGKCSGHFEMEGQSPKGGPGTVNNIMAPILNTYRVVAILGLLTLIWSQTP